MKSARIRFLNAVLFLTVFLTASVLSPVARVHAQSGNTDLDNIVATVTKSASAIENKGYSVVNITIDKGLKDDVYETSRRLYKGNEYVILAVGGVGVSDISISLLDSDKV